MYITLIYQPFRTLPILTTLTVDTTYDTQALGKMPNDLPHEDRIHLAVEALHSGQFRSIRGAADKFDTPKLNLHERVKGGSTRQEAQVKNRKL